MANQKPKIKRPKMTRYTFKDFECQFPTDDACLEWLKNYLYPDGIFCEPCGKITKHHKVASRKSGSVSFSSSASPSHNGEPDKTTTALEILRASDGLAPGELYKAMLKHGVSISRPYVSTVL